MKKCKKCDQSFSLSNFYAHKGMLDGHLNICKACFTIYSDKRYYQNKEKILKTCYNWQIKNKEKRKEICKRYYQKNKDKHNLLVSNWRNKNLDRFKAYSKQWKRDNKEKVCLSSKIRNKRVKLATPPWAKKGNIMEEIKKIYSNCKKGFHVDHIVPLKGKNVCGLHLPWNMQIISAKENSKKNNKFLYGFGEAG